MKSDNQQGRSQYILGAEDIELQTQLPDDSKLQVTTEDRKQIKSTILMAGIALVVVAAVLAAGVIFANTPKKEDPRKSTPTFYGSLDEEDLKEKKIVSMITKAYYTVENGMMVTIGFSNNLDTDEHISKVVVAIYTEKDAELAKAQSESMKEDFVVVAGGTNEVTLYIKPQYVSIMDDPLEKLSYEITIDHETVA
ncbi:MAG: hypothetical protein IJO75_04410 [Clostridia bacterium]|nr:hypothetical protein [Clostridia bacterium]